MSASLTSGCADIDMSSHCCTCYINTPDGDADGAATCRRCEVQILHVVGGGSRTRQRPEEQVHVLNKRTNYSSSSSQLPSGSVLLHQNGHTPTVQLDVFDSGPDPDEDEDDDEDEDGVRQPFVSTAHAPVKQQQLSVTVNRPGTGLSTSSSVVSMPICRICHMPADDEDGLISPCRCAGSMRFIHNGCLMKWLEISSKKSKKQASCELCLYQYHRHKKFKVKHWQFPTCSNGDKVRHLIFVLSLVVMIGAATVTVMCFKHDKGGRVNLDKNQLTRSEVITLVCGVLFFVAFFVAMYVEVKARNTIYKLFLDFLYLNQQWYIDEYDKKADVQPVPV